MSRSRIKVNTNAVASQYACADEKIIEFSSPNGGGLMAFRLMDDGTLLIQVYRQDATVVVEAGRPEEDGTPLPDNRIRRDADGKIYAYASRGYHFEDGRVTEDEPSRSTAHYHDADPDTACRCPKPGTYARQAPNPLEG